MNREATENEIITQSITVDSDGGTNAGQAFSEPSVTEKRAPRSVLSKRNLITSIIIGLLVVSALFFIWLRQQSDAKPGGEAATAEKGEHPGGADHTDEHGAGEQAEVRVEPEALAAANLEYEGVTQRPAVGLLRVTGTVETNPENTQAVTPLIGGRVERVFVGVGDQVNAGVVVAVIASPQIAQMHGKLHEATTALELAQRNLTRVQRTENRVAVLSAKARLDETEATLRRVRKLVELGAGAGKDLIAAETAHRTAQAEYDFQNNISLNRELQEAQAAVATTRVDVAHIRDEMRALGAAVPIGEDDHSKDTSGVSLRAPASGIVTERAVNPGAGIEAGRSLMTISNLSTVYVIANVPESQIGSVRIGTQAEVRSSTLGEAVINGRVSYIDPQLNEATRTARARIEIANRGERLRAGMFVEVGFQTTTGVASGEELVVPASAVQRIENKAVVFVPKEDEPGAFEVREIEVGGESDGYVRVLENLKIGELVVTKGSFTLKTQMQKGEMGDDDH